MKHGTTRDKRAKEEGVICFEIPLGVKIEYADDRLVLIQHCPEGKDRKST
jgi:hypothetical protein